MPVIEADPHACQNPPRELSALYIVYPGSGTKTIAHYFLVSASTRPSQWISRGCGTHLVEKFSFILFTASETIQTSQRYRFLESPTSMSIELVDTVSGWHTLRNLAQGHGVSLTPSYLYSLMRLQGVGPAFSFLIGLNKRKVFFSRVLCLSISCLQ